MSDSIEVKYKADLSGIIKDTTTYENKLKEVETTGKKAFKSTEDAAKKAGSAIKDSSTAVAGMGNALEGIAAGVIAAFSVQKIIAFAEESFKAFAKSEAQTQKLKFALDNITKDGGSFDRLVKQSENLQKSLKIFDAEDIQSIQAAQLQYGLTADQVEKLTPLILELSVAQGTDLATATDTAIKAIEGQTRGLKTVGASFTDTGNSTDNFNLLIEKLAKLQGSAADSLNTTNGQLKAQEVALEDLQEHIGERLTPAWIGLKTAILAAGDALTNFLFPESAKEEVANAVDDLQTKLTTAFKGFSTADIEVALTYTRAQIKKTSDELKVMKTGFVSNKGFADKVDFLKEQTNKELALRSLILQRGEDEKRAGEDSKKSAEIQLLAKENLLALSRKQLEAEIKELEAKDNNTKVFQDELERRKTALTEIIKAQKEAGEKLSKQRADDADKAKADKQKAGIDLANLEASIATKSETDLAKTEQEKLAITLKYALLDLEIKRKAADVPVTDEKYLKARQDLNDIYDAAVLTADNKAKDEHIKVVKAREKEEADIVLQANANLESMDADELDTAEKNAEERKKLWQDVFNVISDVTSAAFDLFQADNQARQDALQERIDSENEIYNTQQDELNALKENGAITDREFQRRQIELTEKRTEAEKKAAKEQKKLKTEAALLSRELAVFEIILNTAKAIMSALATGGPIAPFLAAAAGVTGALELATVLSTPLPKFFKGTKSVEGSDGIDKVPAMLTKGERVVSVDKNRKNWEVYEAIDEGKLDEWIYRKHIVPALQDYQRKSEAAMIKRNNEEIGRVIYANFAGLTAYEADRLRKKGTNINNAGELGTAIGRAVADAIPKQRMQW